LAFANDFTVHRTEVARIGEWKMASQLMVVLMLWIRPPGNHLPITRLPDYLDYRLPDYADYPITRLPDDFEAACSCRHVVSISIRSHLRAFRPAPPAQRTMASNVGGFALYCGFHRAVATVAHPACDRPDLWLRRRIAVRAK